ncbi:MAG: Ldh family oxidoreductase, partial [Alphaproteobacteria bacterium]|nr:Ldh family oxidoreductase [Alphaproteobacteria bacterium]
MRRPGGRPMMAMPFAATSRLTRWMRRSGATARRQPRPSPLTQPPLSKLTLDGARVTVAPAEAARRAARIFERVGCPPARAGAIADHLIDAELCGVESHGIMRTLQYAEQFETGIMRAGAEPALQHDERGAWRVDAGGGSGIPAMLLATDHACAMAKRDGMAAIAVCRAGHSGRLGAYAERAAGAGCLIIIIGGGNRREWPMVTPHGGRKPVLPTNPYCIGIPGGA